MTRGGTEGEDTEKVGVLDPDSMEAEVGGTACLLFLVLLFTPSWGLLATTCGMLGWAQYESKKGERERKLLERELREGQGSEPPLVQGFD